MAYAQMTAKDCASRVYKYSQCFYLSGYIVESHKKQVTLFRDNRKIRRSFSYEEIVTGSRHGPPCLREILEREGLEQLWSVNIVDIN